MHSLTASDTDSKGLSATTARPAQDPLSGPPVDPIAKKQAQRRSVSNDMTNANGQTTDGDTTMDEGGNSGHPIQKRTNCKAMSSSKAGLLLISTHPSVSANLMDTNEPAPWLQGSLTLKRKPNDPRSRTDSATEDTDLDSDDVDQGTDHVPQPKKSKLSTAAAKRTGASQGNCTLPATQLAHHLLN